jgi:ribonuclease HII
MTTEDDPLQDLATQSVQHLRVRYLERGRPVPRGLLERLASDPRKAARDLAEALRARASQNRSEGQRLRRLLRFEADLWARGMTFVAGVDEAGMSPLAGPVVAGAVVLPVDYKLRGLDDSKKILDEDRRDELATAIKRDAVAWGVGRADPDEIDRINIYHAGLLAMRRAVCALGAAPEFVLVDARRIPRCPSPQRGIVHGDALSASIAAASLIAKTTRDGIMRTLDGRYPGYGFAAHKGYPTSEHRQRLQDLGALPIHRRSFTPVREALGLDPVQIVFPDPRRRWRWDALMVGSASRSGRRGTPAGSLRRPGQRGERAMQARAVAALGPRRERRISAARWLPKERVVLRTAGRCSPRPDHDCPVSLTPDSSGI